EADTINVADTIASPHYKTKKVEGKDDMYTLIERGRREAEETEEAKRESKRFLNLN
ncbi:4757_t:CDS:1, partial [Diversispora eburnea]